MSLKIHNTTKSGFTLVELIVVIVLLGVLAVVAAPKFISLQKDAQVAALEGVVAAIDSASNTVYLKAKLQNVSDGNIDIGGDQIPVTTGYMVGRGSSSFLKSINISDITTGLAIDDVCPSSFCTHGNEGTMPDVTGASGGLGVYIWPQNYTVLDDCFAYYYNQENGEKPLIGFIDTGC